MKYYDLNGSIFDTATGGSRQEKPETPKGGYLRGVHEGEIKGYTYEQIAVTWRLWRRFVDCGAIIPESEWNDPTGLVGVVQERIAVITRLYGPEHEN